LRKCFAQIEYKDFLESGYENIFHEFIGQPAPGGGGTPAHRAGGILENIGQFFVLGLKNILLPTPGKRKVKLNPK